MTLTPRRQPDWRRNVAGTRRLQGRFRIRKAEEVQKLQSRVAELEAEVIAATSVLLMQSVMLHRNEVEFTGILKNSILNLVGDHKGSQAIGQATQRSRAITSPASPSAQKSLHGGQLPDMEYDVEGKSGARAGS